MATALLGLAYAAMFTGDAPRASALAEESLAQARESGDPLILAQALFFMSWVASNGAGFEQAAALATEALDLFTTLGDAGGRAEALFVLGTVEIYSARYQEAVAFFTDSANQHRAHGAEPILARDLGGLGTALLNLGDLPRARAVLDESLEVARRYRGSLELGHVTDAARPRKSGRGRCHQCPGRAGRGGVAVPGHREHGLPALVPGRAGQPRGRAGRL